MKKFLLSMIAMIAAISVNAQTWSWAADNAKSATDATDAMKSLAVDNYGTVSFAYAVGAKTDVFSTANYVKFSGAAVQITITLPEGKSFKAGDSFVIKTKGGKSGKPGWMVVGEDGKTDLIPDKTTDVDASQASYTSTVTLSSNFVSSNTIVLRPATASEIYTDGTTTGGGSFYVASIAYTEYSAPAPSINFTTDPADGSTVESIKKVYVTFPDATAADVVTTIYQNAVKNAAGETVCAASLSWGPDESKLNQLTWEAGSKITEAGTYTITIPAGAITLDNVATTQDITFTLTVGEATPTTAKVEFSLPYRKNTADVVKSYTYNAPETGEGGTTVTGWPTGMFEVETGKFLVVNLDEENYQVDSVLVNDKKVELDHSSFRTLITEFTSVEIFAIEKPAAINFTTDPATGSTVSEINKVTITFPDFAAADINTAILSGCVKNAAGEVVNNGSVTYNWVGDANQLIWQAGTKITEAGTYTITIPAGAITLGDGETMNATTSDVVFTLTVGEATPTTAKVEFSLPYRKNTADVVKSYTYNAPETGEGGTTVTGWPTGMFEVETGKFLVVNLDEENYQVDSVLVNDKKVELDHSSFRVLISEFTSVEIFAIEKPATLNYTTDPADGSTVSSLKNVVITFPDYTVADVNSWMLADCIKNEAGESLGAGILTYGPDESKFNQITWEYGNKAITTAGTYTITIPAGAISLGDGETMNPTTTDIVFTITVDNATAIDAVSAALAGNEKVYNINGVRVNQAKKGIFIINGKKVCVK